MEVLCLSFFCYALLCVYSIFAIILKRRRKLVALLSLSYRCIVTINILREKSLAIYFEDSQSRRNMTFNFIVSNIYVDKRSRVRFH